jgi:hypothetical protein
LSELIGIKPHATGHAGKRGVHFGIADLETPLLAFLHLEDLRDQLFQDLLARRHFVCRQLVELGALLDVERCYRLTVYDRDHLLRGGSGRQNQPNGACQHHSR